MKLKNDQKESQVNINSYLKFFLWHLLLLLIFVIIWELSTAIGFSNPDVFPPPSQLVKSVIELLISGILITNTLNSLARVLVGFSIATILGIFLGVMLGTWIKSGRSIDFFINLFRPIPPIAWIPIAILWFGLSNFSAIFIVFIGAFFPIYLNTYTGVQSVSQNHINAARSLGANKALIIKDVIIPAASPQILTGIRVGIGIAWTSIIAAEMIGAQSGLGYAIQLNRTMLEMEAVIINMIAIGVIGGGMNYLTRKIEKQLTLWKEGNDSHPS